MMGAVVRQLEEDPHQRVMPKGDLLALVFAGEQLILDLFEGLDGVLNVVQRVDGRGDQAEV